MWHDVSAGDWLWMTTMMLVFWGLLAWVVIAIIRAVTRDREQPPADPEAVLRERFARGEVDEQELGSRLSALRRHSTAKH